jgi:hypothetical protein
MGVVAGPCFVPSRSSLSDLRVAKVVFVQSESSKGI